MDKPWAGGWNEVTSSSVQLAIPGPGPHAGKSRLLASRELPGCHGSDTLASQVQNGDALGLKLGSSVFSFLPFIPLHADCREERVTFFLVMKAKLVCCRNKLGKAGKILNLYETSDLPPPSPQR